MSSPLHIGLLGLGNMGQGFARNLEMQGRHVAIWNRTQSVTEQFLQEQSGKNFTQVSDLPGFRGALPGPRVLLLFLPHSAVRAMISPLLEVLEPGDVIVDCGNSWYQDTFDLHAQTAQAGVSFVGVGVSGGPQGALEGPSMMVGGAEEGGERVRELLEDSAARDMSGGRCISVFGGVGSGHLVKMVHNGIEYAIMQILAELGLLLEVGTGANPEASQQLWREVSAGQSEGLLTELLGGILSARGSEGELLVRSVANKVGQKGTGRWTAQEGLRTGVPLPLITLAVQMRSYQGSLAHSSVRLELDPESLRRILDDAVKLAFLEGFSLLRSLAEEGLWNGNLQEVARIWQGGCILQMRGLQDWEGLFSSGSNSPVWISDSSDWTRLREWSSLSGVATPALALSSELLGLSRGQEGGARYLAALRDSFGDHGYYALNDPHTLTSFPWPRL